MKNPYLQLGVAGWPDLAAQAWNRLENHTHGDLPGWLDAINELPEGNDQFMYDFQKTVIKLANGEEKFIEFINDSIYGKQKDITRPLFAQSSELYSVIITANTWW